LANRPCTGSRSGTGRNCGAAAQTPVRGARRAPNRPRQLPLHPQRVRDDGAARAASTTSASTARRATTATRGRRGSAQAAASAGVGRRYLVVFQTELVIQAISVQDAIRQAESRGARDISSVTASS